jgi:hypothetical protein
LDVGSDLRDLSGDDPLAQVTGQRYFARQHLHGLSKDVDQEGDKKEDAVDVSAFVVARDRMLAGIVAFQTAERAKPGSPAQVTAAGFLPSLPSAGSYGSISGSYIGIAHSFAEYQSIGHSAAFHIGGLSEDVCSAINSVMNGRSYVPEWPEHASGCFYWGTDQQNHFYAYAPQGPTTNDGAIAAEFVAVAWTMAQAISRYESTHGASRPSDVEALTSTDALGSLPLVRGVSTMQNGFIGIARSAADYNAIGLQPAWSMSGVSDGVCREVSARISGRSYIPAWPENQSGCFYWGTTGRNHVYGYVGKPGEGGNCATRPDGTNTCGF